MPPGFSFKKRLASFSVAETGNARPATDELQAARSQSVDTGTSGLGYTIQSVSSRNTDPQSPSAVIEVSQLTEQFAHLWPDGARLGLTPVHSPADVLADIIFVHGLMGASHRTWTHLRHDSRNFWPAWLPDDIRLSGARISTFGYAANVGYRSQNKVSIREIALKLVHEMQYSTLEPKFGSRPIIFVCHSMGGLVAKQALVLGLNQWDNADMMRQVKAMIFFSTPHRGDGLAKALDMVLDTIGAPHDYIKELGRDSPFLNSLNKEFAQRNEELNFDLFSFYETMKTKGVLGRKYVVVDRESGVMGLPNEKECLVEADHHAVCKFENRQDPRYDYIRGVLSKLISPYDRRGYIDDMKKTAILLSIEETELEGLESRFKASDNIKSVRRFDGENRTCSWVLDRDWFKSWYSGDDNIPRLLCIWGQAGAGKSHLATWIADYISGWVGDSYCLYHRFVSSDQNRRTASYLLRTLAFQAAGQIRQFREVLLQTTLATFGVNDVAPIWEKVFRGILFKLTLSKPLYWVIDGLDESSATPALFDCLRTLEAQFSIRILLLSQPNQDVSLGLQKLSNDRGIEIQLDQHHITKYDTENDMKRLVEESLGRVVSSIVPYKDVIEHFIRRASGNFLWVSLTTRGLKETDCITARTLGERLNRLPIEMNQYYMNMLGKIEELAVYKQALTTVLTWATFSHRPLHVREMECTLQLQTLDPLPDLNYLVKSCGGLVQIGSSGVLTLVHDTARQFLQENSKPILGQSSSDSQAFLASLCLQYLSSTQIDVGWRTKLSRLEREIDDQDFSKNSESLSSIFRRESPLLAYAAQFWAYHLSLSDPNSDILWASLQRFFEKDCLTWINTLALLSDLNSLVHSAQHIKTYMKKIKKSAVLSLETVSDRTGLLKVWTEDWIKIVGTLGSNLIEKPASIYNSVLPFCPTSSITRRTYETSSQSTLSVTGITFAEWSGCNARLSIGSESTISKVYATAEAFAALVPQERSLVVWDAKTYEELHRIHHGEYVMIAAVNKKGDLVATCGQNTIKIWNLNTGKQLGFVNKQGNDLVMALKFGATDDEILVGYQNHLVVIHNWTKQLATSFWAQQQGRTYQGLHAVSFSPDGTRVAVSSRTRRVEIWDIRKQKFIRHVTPKNEARHGNEDVFNPAGAIQWHPTSAYLFLIYHSMNLVYCNAEYDHQIEHDDIKANVILCSPCGNFLLTSHYSRSVKVYSIPDYSSANPTFTLLYHLECSEYMWDFAWSPNGERLYEVRDSICSVWAPVELILPDGVDPEERRLSVTTEKSTGPVAFVSSNKHITAIASAPYSGAFCYARDDGLLCLDRIGATRKERALKGHFADAIIGTLLWSPSGNWLASADDSGHVMIRRILISSSPTTQKNRIFKPASLRLQVSIKQLLFSPDDQFLLISTSSDDLIWNVADKRICQKHRPQLMEQAKWIIHPADPSKLVSIGRRTERTLTWAELASPPSEAPPFRTVKWQPNTQYQSSASTLATVLEDQTQIGPPMDHEFIKSSTQQRDLRILISEILLAVSSDATDISLVGPVTQLLKQVSKFIGRLQNKVVFFDQSHWLCMWEVGSSSYERHLQLPNTWINPETLELSVLGFDSALLCPKNGEVAVVRNWVKERHDVRLVSLAV